MKRRILNRWNELFEGEQSAQQLDFYENESYPYIDGEIEEPTILN